MSSLLHQRSRLAGTHRVATRLGAVDAPPLYEENILFGTRGIKRPLIALTTKKDMGPCRHALAQMVVAGTMVVHTRPGTGAGPAAPKTEPRILTFTPPPVKEPDDVAPPPPRSPPPRAAPPPPRPAARPQVDRHGRAVTVERTVIETFTPTPTEDE